jgi:hypothetical protein
MSQKILAEVTDFTWGFPAVSLEFRQDAATGVIAWSRLSALTTNLPCPPESSS